MRTHAVVAAVVLLTSAPLGAQQASVGRLEGTLRGIVDTRPVSAASVSLVRLEAATSTTVNASVDAQGRFHLDGLPAGRYLLQLNSPTLDSLDLALQPDEVRIVAGKTSRSELMLPYGAQLRDVICHGLALQPGKSAVAGRATDADTDQPIAGADVVAAWTEVDIDKTTLKSKTQRRTAVVKTGSLGEYRMCGVPTARRLTMQLQSAGRAGAIVALAVSGEEGAVVRDLSLSPRSAPTIAALDSVERTVVTTDADTTREELQLTGTASLTGVIRGAEGQPLSGVQLHVRDARSSALTDNAGRYQLGNLPAGTQVVLVRHLGYAVTEVPVELRSGRSVTHDVKLTRAALLDSVHVVASKPRLAEFEYNRRTNAMGKFMTLGDIQRRDAKQTSDLVRALGGFYVDGSGDRAKILARGATVAQPTCRDTNVRLIVDGLEGLEVNDISPGDIEAIEAYPDVTSTPAKWVDHAPCGLIAIWLRPARFGQKAAPRGPTALKGNGYP